MKHISQREAARNRRELRALRDKLGEIVGSWPGTTVLQVYTNDTVYNSIRVARQLGYLVVVHEYTHDGKECIRYRAIKPCLT